MACNVFQESFFLLLAVFCLSFSFSKAQMVPAMFVFGDSLIDVGNNNYLRLSIAKANYPHNGIDFPTKMPTGRFSNGKNSADFLAEKVGLPTSPPYLSLRNNKNKTSLFMNGVSFASAGAGIFNDTNQVLGQLIPLTKQVDYYATVYEDLMKQLGLGGAQQHLSKSLFVVVIGSSDIFHYLGSSDLQNKHTPQQYVTLMTTNLEPQLRRIYKFGARKFVVVGLGQIGCTPLQRVENQAEECNEEVNSWCVNYNERLKTMLQELISELQDLSYSYFEAYDFMQLQRVENQAEECNEEVNSWCVNYNERLKTMLQELISELQDLSYSYFEAYDFMQLQRVENQAEECNEEVNSWCVNYNERLKTMLQELISELQDLSYSYFEAYDFMQNIVQDPATYGFTAIKEACCGIGKLKARIPCVPLSTYCDNRNESLFWDFCHLSQAASRIFVDAIFDGPSQYTFPINMSNLVAV